MNKKPEPVLYYVHDPMCSWCFGFKKTRRALFARLPDNLEIKWLVGGLAPDSDEPMPDDMRTYIQNTWKKIQDHIPGVEFNFEFWKKNQPRRSTYPACRAVIAAGEQGEKYSRLMVESIQTAYYQQARNTSDNSTLIEIANEAGLNVEQLEKDLLDKSTQQKLLTEIKHTRQLGANSFPSLVLVSGNAKWRIQVDYTNDEPMHELIMQLLEDF